MDTNQSAITSAQHGLDVNYLPENVAVYSGQDVTFTCRVEAGAQIPRVQWFEYACNSEGNLISDGSLIVADHPQAERYSLVRVSQLQYDLHIRDVRRTDGGKYMCVDTAVSDLEKKRHSAELVVFDGPLNCSTAIPIPPIAALEDTYYWMECEILFKGNIRPKWFWHGPPPFGQLDDWKNEIGWSGMAFYANRSMDGQHWTLRLNFTDSFLPVPADSATNIPTFVDEFDTDTVVINWVPKSISSSPSNPANNYEVGETIECTVDAFPAAEFRWQNMRTLEILHPGSTFVIPSSWQGFEQIMRCTATNIINDWPYANALMKQVNVPITADNNLLG